MNAHSIAGSDRGTRGGRRSHAPSTYLPWAVLLVQGITIALLTHARFPSLWAVGWAVFDLDQSTGPDIGITLSEVVDHPEAMWDRSVTVSADVHEVVDEHAMVIGASSLFNFRTNALVVLAPGPLADLADGPLTEDQTIRITGVVKPFEPETLERELSISLDDPPMTEHGNKVVLVAQRIEVGVSTGVVPGDPEFGGGAGYEVGITIYDLTHHTDEYLGDTVTVSDEVEEGLLTGHAFWLGDEKLLVISPEPVPGVFVETTAYVTGEVRRFDLREVEEMTGIDLDDEHLQELQGQPFILADRVIVLT